MATARGPGLAHRAACTAVPGAAEAGASLIASATKGDPAGFGGRLCYRGRPITAKWPDLERSSDHRVLLAVIVVN